jgi:hypothetical protein
VDVFASRGWSVGSFEAVSKRIQAGAKARAERARQRAQNALSRALASHIHGEHGAARAHERSARAQARSADLAEQNLAADRWIEGDQLDDQPARDRRRM